MSKSTLWQTKLAAMFHDPPDKCLQISGDLSKDEKIASFKADLPLLAQDDYDLAAVKAANVFTTAADRFAFPKKKCDTIYQQGKHAFFKHPLAPTTLTSEISDLPDSSEKIHKLLRDAMTGIATDDPHQLQFLLWRRWLENAIALSPDDASGLAYLPADTRIPDHSIWLHNSMTSALAGCVVDGKLQPALLLFQLGGVQEFISQARSTRDLWSGSYLLSWLMATAMKAVSDEIGPDAIVFPNLRGNGIFDALHRESMYQVNFRDQDGKQTTLWELMQAEKNSLDEYLIKSKILKEGQKASSSVRWLTTPTLPNRFLAVVPEGQAEALAQKASAAIEKELRNIGDAVWKWFAQEANEKNRPGIDNWKKRWDAQLKAFPQITWAVQPWLEREQCLQAMEDLPANKADAAQQAKTPLQSLLNTLQLVESWIDVEDRKEKYFTDPGLKDKLNDQGFFWSAHYALLDAKLAARRNTRDFSAWDNPWPEASVKDSLSGKEEIIGDEEFWKHLTETYELLFTAKAHRYGAMNLIKRLWCRDDKVDYLRQKLGLNSNAFKKGMGFDSVQEVAEQNFPKSAYVAVLAMDGDQMGKWVSGQNAPKFLQQLSEPAKNYLQGILAEHGCESLPRLLSPSYHLQFSDALANFATWMARLIVEFYDGQLIYAGGDDVLALLPATKAITCARALRAAFRGEAPADMSSMPFSIVENGFVNLGLHHPLLVPGPDSDVSVGLAIGHQNSPLQMLVREATAAERRAKQEYRRGAIALSLYKRSGEIIQWGCKWDSHALPLMELFRQLSTPLTAKSEPAQDQEQNKDTHTSSAYLSARFPYTLASFLQPYQLDKPLAIPVEQMQKIISQEIKHVMLRQGSELLKAANKDDSVRELQNKLQQLIDDWLADCSSGQQTLQRHLAGEKIHDDDAVGGLGDFIQPFLTDAFINRSSGGEA